MISTTRNSRHTGLRLAAMLAFTISVGTPLHAQERFPTPEAAMQALVDAAKAGAPGFVDRIFGPGAAKVLASGDTAENERNLKAFNDAAAERSALVAKGDSTRVLQIGRNAYDFPVPIVKRGDGWEYDLAAGREELANRRVGLNELSAIDACRAYVQAQREYFRMDPDGDEVPSYASRILSSPGKRDGLYWPPENQADRSPLDGQISDAALARRGDKPEPYRGYYFRILTAQGPAAPGGRYSYVINGQMLAGFALVAYPAEWGTTGVMTFICGQQGRVYQRNLGPNSAVVGATLPRYNPGPGWTLVE